MYTETLTLANGVKIPQLGLGTWFIDDANAVEAYSPIAHGEILHQPEIQAMAEKYGVTVPQLCIRYTLQLGAVSLPKTANPAHMEMPSVFDGRTMEHPLTHLRLTGVQQFESGAVWLRYAL